MKLKIVPIIFGGYSNFPQDTIYFIGSCNLCQFYAKPVCSITNHSMGHFEITFYDEEENTYPPCADFCWIPGKRIKLL